MLTIIQDMAAKTKNSTPAPSSTRIRFDEVDLAILERLQTDSKLTNATLARLAGISPAGALERVRKLEAAGVIRGYAARLDPGAVGQTITALVQVSLREHGEARLDEFKRAVDDFEEIQAAWHTTGEEDFILKVLVRDMEHYERFVVHRLSALPNIGRVRTNFCLAVVKDETRVPLDAVGGADHS
ncbi:MAG: Lrp/AsnC family transcriptional regulator [Phycisphaeraceae bacterium]|nr:MAG: Lrp/AsnC family transcriptional regulator [Phycisphaeraceae bacterium]